MTAIPCPVGRMPDVVRTTHICGTMLQPYQGRLTNGVAAHLTTVHQLPEDAAQALATTWVNQGGPRATG